MMPTNETTTATVNNSISGSSEGRIGVSTDIEGYVLDNMEGAVDQASFLATLDMPIAIIGAHGTGKMYVAKVVHKESGRSEGMLVQIDCRAFRNRDDAIRRIQKELTQGEGKTLVFKSPHLMSADAQLKLARQIATRTLADVSPARYLPDVKLVALFPDTISHLISRSGLTEKLATVFSGFPIYVPPIKDRKQAVLRWAHKILGQTSASRGRYVKGFTADAERAMLTHEWPGNISEIRQRIVKALDVADSNHREWITPVDLGIYKNPGDSGAVPKLVSESFLEAVEESSVAEESYNPSALEQLGLALGEAVNNVVSANVIEPLGVWLVDDMVLAAKDRYQGSLRCAAEFLHTNPRNVTRWTKKINERADARNTNQIWSDSHRLISQWVWETPLSEVSPIESARSLLIAHIENFSANLGLAAKAKIMGMSTPTYQKRVKEYHD